MGQGDEFGCMQVGENRIASLEPDEEDEKESSAPAMIVRDDGAFRHEKQWRGAAVALPVFSLRTRDSVGAGEFEDIKKLVDVCDAAGVFFVLLCRLRYLLVSAKDTKQHVRCYVQQTNYNSGTQF